MLINANDIKPPTVILIILLMIFHFGWFLLKAINIGTNFIKVEVILVDIFDYAVIMILIVDLILSIYMIILFTNFYNALSIKSLTVISIIGIVSLIIRLHSVNIVVLNLKRSLFNNIKEWNAIPFILILSIIFVIIILGSSIFQFLATSAFYILKPKKLSSIGNISMIIMATINIYIALISDFTMIFSGFSVCFYSLM
ncbi:MAG: hypothetical protein OEY49_19650, partial [Candidatus Heimdallarchaeota archaeon]|nr:hypothetical protein [Candidatus Heimdallarchaeota archaeon]